MKFEEKQATKDQIDFGHMRILWREIGRILGGIIVIGALLIAKYYKVEWYTEIKKITVGDIVIVCIVFLTLSCIFGMVEELLIHKKVKKKGYRYLARK